ncbi:MAG: hypothetical protein AB8B91_21250 [Rubripirellula sp.]
MFRRVLIAGSLGCLLASQLIAQTPVLESAIARTPSDAVFFHSWLNNRDSLQRMANSEIATEIRRVPAAKAILDGYSALGTVSLDDQDPDTVSLLAYRDAITNLLGDEIFFYAESSLLDLNRRTRRWKAMAAEASDSNESFRSEEFFMSLPDEEFASLTIPGFVLGARLSNLPAGRGYVGMIQLLASSSGYDWMHVQQDMIDSEPVVSIRMDGSQIPWGDDSSEDETSRLASERFKRLISDRSITIAAGIRDGFLIVSFGEDLGPLQRFPAQDHLLAVKELEPLREAAVDHPIAIDYRSDPWAASCNESDHSMIEWFAELVEANPNLITTTDSPMGVLSESTHQQIAATLREFDSQSKAIRVPAVGKVGWWFMDDAGVTGETHHHGAIDRRRREGRPDVLSRVGSEPLLVYASSGQVDTKLWELAGDFASFCVKSFAAYYQAMVSSAGDAPDQELAELSSHIDQISQHFTQLVDTFQHQWLTGFGDQGWAFAITRDRTSEHYPIKAGWIASISDAPAISQNARNLRNALNELSASYLELADEPQTNASVIPLPQITQSDNGTFAKWPLPMEAPTTADSDQPKRIEFLPQALLTENWLAIGLSSETLVDLVNGDTKSQLPLLKEDHIVTSYIHLNVADYIAAITPGMQKTFLGQTGVVFIGPFPIPVDPNQFDEAEENEFPAGNAPLISEGEGLPEMSQQEGLQLLRALQKIKHYTRVTLIEDGQTVVRWRLLIE